jgi:hypothetical protein
MRRFFSTPGSDAYCGRSLNASQDSGGLFHPGTAVEPWAGVGGEDAFGASACGVAGLACASFVGAVSGALVCPAAASGSASANPTMIAPKWRA